MNNEINVSFSPWSVTATPKSWGIYSEDPPLIIVPGKPSEPSSPPRSPGWWVSLKLDVEPFLSANGESSEGEGVRRAELDALPKLRDAVKAHAAEHGMNYDELIANIERAIVRYTEQLTPSEPAA